jgi:hypothetical protein
VNQEQMMSPLDRLDELLKQLADTRDLDRSIEAMFGIQR